MSNLDDDQENGEELAMVHVRNALEVGPGGKQIQLEDPDGDPIELFEPAR
jgi:glyoxylase I family protein